MLRLGDRLRQARHRRERAQLLQRLPERSVGVEIGVWAGDFSAAILRAVRPTRLHLVDPWTFAPEEPYAQAWYGGARASSQADMDEVYERVRQRFEHEVGDGVVVIHRSTSAEAAVRFEDASLDWVYVDGNHLYGYVRTDLELFAPKVRPGGLLAGDDYGAAGWWDDGVRRAVDRFLVTEVGAYEPLFLRDQFLLRRAA
ncbi:MAG TPA: class I SAM-dependent methyltransferase [Gaiellaceae bacterium]|nr:class I SAM-dependent methyltransferase [Gaiellaceae bacterium]